MWISSFLPRSVILNAKSVGLWNMAILILHFINWSKVHQETYADAIAL